jgi:hypothetical protein
MSALQALEIASAAFGIAGAWLLAIRARWAGWAFVLWLASNLGWMAYGATHGMWGLFAQHAAFSITSAIGIRNWLWVPSRGRSNHP